MISRKIAAILMFSAAMAVPAGAASAATITPTTGADQHAAGGQCSLREAIASANSNANMLGCTHTGTYGDDTVSLTLPSYTLSVGADGENADAGGDLDVEDAGSLSLAGPVGGTAVVDASGIAGGDRVIHVLGNASLSISNLTVTGGNTDGAGGGIQNQGSLAIVSSTISGNQTDANGGGIFGGPLSVSDSTVSGNVSGSYGGGVNSFGLTGLTNSTITGNLAASNGAGVASQSGTMILSSVTVSGNSSGIDFTGIAMGSSLTLRNTILSGNGPAGSSQCTDGGTITSAGYNLVGSMSECPFAAATGDLTAADPLLGPLAGNGGATLTRALLAGSPALDHGSGCPPADQRGTGRPQGAQCDIGAFELEVPNEVPKCGGLPATIIGTAGNEKLKGTNGKDVIAGLAGNDKLKGLKGNDVLCGGPGKDKLSGGPGKDRLLGDAGRDKLKGGPGNDRLSGGPGKDKLHQ
jgi:Ca2+-binding RTX toxin-like protein